MKKKLLPRALVCMLAMLMVLVLVVPKPVSAASQSYSIVSADFDITLSEDGDAIVTETWVLDFKSGDFTRFSKQIYRGSDMADYEGADYAQYYYFYIDGEPVHQTENTASRPDRTWGLVETEDNIELNWYMNIHSPRRVEFKCKYILVNTIYQLADGNAVFAYRVVGAKFDKVIDNTTVTVHLPGESGQIKNYSGLPTVEVGKDSISLHQGSHSGLQKVIVTMDRSLFGEIHSSRALESSFRENLRSDKMGPMEIMLGLLSIALTGGIFYRIYSSGKKSNAKRAQQLAEARAKRDAFLQKLEANPDLIKQRLQELEEAGITPMNFACSFAKSGKSGTVFLMGMLCQMVNEGYASIDDDEISILDGSIPTDKGYKQIRNAMESVLPYEKRDGMMVFDNRKMSNVMESLSKDCDFFSRLDLQLGSMAVRFPEEKAAAVQDIQDYFRYIPFNSDLNNILQLAKENGEVDPLLLAGVFTGVMSGGGTINPLENLASQCILIRNARLPKRTGGSNSDSGCGGCSGCSSCSGCGGGGAD